MAKIILLCVEKLANSSLLSAFSASSRTILSYFSCAPALCKGLSTKNMGDARAPADGQ